VGGGKDFGRMPGDVFIPQGRFWKKSKKISSKLNERGRVLVPSFGSADRSEISKKFYRGKHTIPQGRLWKKM